MNEGFGMRISSFPVGCTLVAMCLPSVVSAYCSEPLRYRYRSFDEQVGAYLDYLLCLHNEQVTSLNEHAVMLNQLGDDLDGLQRKPSRGQDVATVAVMREVVVNYTAMKQENEQLRQRLKALEARLDLIEQRAEAE